LGRNGNEIRTYGPWLVGLASRRDKLPVAGVGCRTDMLKRVCKDHRMQPVQLLAADDHVPCTKCGSGRMYLTRSAPLLHGHESQILTCDACAAATIRTVDASGRVIE